MHIDILQIRLHVILFLLDTKTINTEFQLIK